MERPVRALLEGNWGNVYPQGSSGTSPTGWLVIAAPLTMLFSFLIDISEAYVVANLFLLPALLFVSRYTINSIWPDTRPTTAWLLSLATVLAPTTLATYMNAYHPQDLAAVILVVLAAGLLHKQHSVLAGLTFGVAIMTRQWALLAFLPAAGFTRQNNFWKFTVSAGSTIVLLATPFLVSGGNEGWFQVFTSNSVRGTGDTIFGLLQVQGGPTGNSNVDLTLFVARVTPVVLAAAIGVWVWHKKLVKPEHLIVAMTCGLATRMIFDVSNYLYYWVPFAILFVLLIPYRKIFWVPALIYGFAPWVLDALIPTIGTTMIPEGETISITQTHRVLRSSFTLMLAVGVPTLAVLLLGSQDTKNGKPHLCTATKRDVAGATKQSTFIAVWVAAALAWSGVIVTLVASPEKLEPIKATNERMERQQEAKQFLIEEGVDIHGTSETKENP